MNCDKCLKKDWCPYIHQFNHDMNVGCTDFQDRDYTTYVSNTLNIMEENMGKELTPLEVSKQLKDFVLEVVKNGLDRMFINGSFDIIEKTLKDYEELTNKPVMLYGRTHGHTQALMDTICKNYKDVTITNIEDEKKLKALEIIKKKQVSVADFIYACMCSQKDLKEYYNCDSNYEFACDCVGCEKEQLTPEEYDLLKEVLL